jgi:hypothetical protein
MIRGSLETQLLHLLAPTVIAVIQTARAAKISIAFAVRSTSLRSVIGASRRCDLLTQAQSPS